MAYSRINELWNRSRPHILPPPQKLLTNFCSRAGRTQARVAWISWAKCMAASEIIALTGIIYFSLLFLCLCLCNSSCSICMFCKIQHKSHHLSDFLTHATCALQRSGIHVFVLCAETHQKARKENKIRKMRFNNFWDTKLGGISHMVDSKRIALNA